MSSLGTLGRHRMMLPLFFLIVMLFGKNLPSTASTARLFDSILGIRNVQCANPKLRESTILNVLQELIRIPPVQYSRKWQADWDLLRSSLWHTDVAYEDPPNTSTVVYAVKVPESGGRTWFANQYAAQTLFFSETPWSPQKTAYDLSKAQTGRNRGHRHFI